MGFVGKTKSAWKKDEVRVEAFIKESSSVGLVAWPIPIWGPILSLDNIEDPG